MRYVALDHAPWIRPWIEGEKWPCEEVLPVQTHTTNVVVAEETDSLDDVDGLLTFRSDYAVGVRTADCVPVVLYAPTIGCVAAVHSGWRGTIGGIVTSALRRMISRGADPAEIRAVIGAAICGECYEVSQQMCDDFVSTGLSAGVRNRHIDLREVVRSQIEACGVPSGNIAVDVDCTRHSVDAQGRYKFPSWRREPGVADRIVTSIARLTSAG